jgi:hypothetical protein
MALAAGAKNLIVNRGKSYAMAAALPEPVRQRFPLADAK